MKPTVAAALFGCLLFAPFSAQATDFTLSDAAIMSLDYQRSYLTATVTSKEDVPGPGVLFTIHFPSTNTYDCALYLASYQHSGNGTLVGLDVSAYSHFNLSFTLLSIDGIASGGQTFGVGAVIGAYDGKGSAYRVASLSLNGLWPSSAVSSTTNTCSTVGTIGFTAYIWNDPQSWSDGPHDVTLLVAPAVDAVIIPEPTTWIFVLLGTVTLLGIVLKAPIPGTMPHSDAFPFRRS